MQLKCHSHIPDNLLLRICERFNPLLDRETKSSVPGVKSLLGCGNHSVQRKAQGEFAIVKYTTYLKQPSANYGVRPKGGLWN